MPEVICLISSSPPPSRHPSPPPPATKPSNAAPKSTTKPVIPAPFELSSSPLPEITKKTNAKTYSAGASFTNLQDNAPTINTATKSATSATATTNSDPKLNGKEYVFLDDNFSSDLDPDIEYSLHLSQVRERAAKRVAGQSNAQSERVSPRTAARGSTFVRMHTAHSSPESEATTLRYKQGERVSPRTAARGSTFTKSYAAESSPEPEAVSAPETAPKTATTISKTQTWAPPTAPKTQITNKDYFDVDDDFSSSFDIDKEYDLGLPAQKKRKVTPEPSSYKELEKQGLPSLLSSGGRKRVVGMGKDDELDHLFGPVGGGAKTSKDASQASSAGAGRRGIGGVSRATPQAAGKTVESRPPIDDGLDDLFGPVGGAAKTRKDSIPPRVTKAPTPDLPAMPKAAANVAATTKPAKRPEKRVLDSDPITFTSSPDFAQLHRDRIKRRDAARPKPKELSDIDEPAPKPSAASKAAPALLGLDSDSDDVPELPGLATTSLALSRTTSDTSYLNPSRPAKKPLSRSKSLANPSKPKRVTKTAEEKVAETAEKLAAKELAAEEKKRLREEKARDKIIAQDLAKVNMLKTDKKKSTPEMIVLFPSELDTKLRQTAEGFLTKLEVEYRRCAGAGTTIGEQLGSGEVKNVIRWKRKVDAIYNSNEDIWEPVPRRIETEKHVLVCLPAKEFVSLATNDEGEDLNDHVEKLQARWLGYKIIYLIEGLTIWQKKNTNLRNRQFASAVRAQISSGPPPSSQTSAGGTRKPRKKKAAAEYISDDLIEDALLSLQVRHGISGSLVIHHTANLVESAEWISIFTQHISTIPYRLQKMNLDTQFCMESGQVRAGEGRRDTFVKMLCEMRGVTAPVGWGIESELGAGVSELMKLFKKDGKEALKEVKKSANRDGAFTDRNVGKAISKRVYNVFMGRDPGSTDV